MPTLLAPTAVNHEVLASGFQFVEAPRVGDDGSVYFSDLTGGGYYRLNPSGGVDCVLRDRIWIGGAVLDHSGSILLGGKGGVIRLNPATGETKEILSVIDGTPIIAVNDMEADGRGGLFGGTLDFHAVFERGEVPTGGLLFHLSRDGKVRVLREGLAVSNGMAFSPDGKWMYHSETTRGIWIYPLNAEGIPGRAELFAPLEDSDGLVADVEGGIWVACWQSAQLLRYGPDGVLERRIALPFPRIVSLCFGGKDLTELYIATGSDDDHPGVGGIVRIHTEIPGVRPWKSAVG